jgi:hypothetical protein
MKDPSPTISLLPLVGVGEDGAWPPGIVRLLPIFKRDGVTVWNGKSEQTPVAVSVLEPSASDTAASAFVEAARRLDGAPPLPNVLAVTSVDPKGQWVVHAPVLGPLADFPGLGWKLPRKLQFFTALCRAVTELHEKDLAHGALTPWSVALDEAVAPVLVSASGDSIWALGEGLEYIAPELLLGATPTPLSDVYSLGRVLIFMMLASHPPIDKEDVPRLDYLKEAPAGLTRIIRRATLVDSGLRYQSVAELLVDVRNYGDLENVGLALATAIELNKTKMSTPPKAPPPRREAAPAREGQPAREVPKYTPSTARSTQMTAPARPMRLVALLVAFVVLSVVAFGSPLFHAVAVWRARRAFASADSADKGQALAKLAALGERDLGALRLVGADLSHLPLTGVSMPHADLSNAKLDGADLGESDLSGATLTGASAFGTDLGSTNVTDAQGLDSVVCDEGTFAPVGWRCLSGHLAPK